MSVVQDQTVIELHDATTTAFDGSRRAWQDLADRLLAATDGHASPTGALVRLPGPSSASGAWSDGMEGFARTFLLAAFRIRGAEGSDPHRLLERFRRGLIAGVDPAGAERWPTIAERRQSVVEAASVAIALSETRPWLWDTLDDRHRQHVIDWLSGVVGTSGYTNNWIWFQNVIEAFLASVDGPWRQDDLDRNAEIAEALYVGDGWYSDGASPTGVRQSFDYYAGWAWHVYPLLHTRIQGVPLADVHRERLAAFVDETRHLVGSRGAPLFQGRSLTYRFGMLAPYWAAAVAGVTPLAPGATRDLAADVASHFLDAGAIDDDGLLSIGWHRRFPRIRQVYTSGSSPYWASKGFLGLLLPEGHPEWSARPTATDQRTRSTLLAAPGWLVVETPADGIVRVLNHGSDGFRGPAGAARADNPFYERLGYSNVTAPDLTVRGSTAPLDAHVALVDAHGEPSHRDVIERVHLSETVAVSRSRVHWLDTTDGDTASWAALRRGPVLTVASIVRGPVELRLAWWSHAVRVDRPLAPDAADEVWPEDEGPWGLRIGGWALPLEDASPHIGDGIVTRADGVRSAVIPVRGLDVVEVAVQEHPNPFSSRSAIPWAARSTPLPERQVVAALVVLAGETGETAEAVDVVEVAVPPVIEVGRDIRIRWSDGSVDRVPTGDEVVS